MSTLQVQEPATTPANAITTTIENGWQMPSRLYADPAVFQIEQDAIFKKSWQCVGRVSDLSKPGDYITAQLGELPIFVVRDETGHLRGHVNACRHRLHPVALGESGCKQIFQCRYHGWTFNHDGSLRAAPGMEHCDDFDKSDMGLIPVRVDIFRDFLFANADPVGEDLATFLENAGEFANELDMEFEHWKHSGTLSYEVDADWKLFVENSLECYHYPLAHQDSFSVHFGTQADEYITREFNNVLTHFAPITQRPTKAEANCIRGFRFLYIWPSTMIFMDEYVAFISRIIPMGHQKTRFVVDTYTDPNADPELIEQRLNVYDATIKEYKEVVTAQQSIAGAVPQERLMAHREVSIKMFQRQTWAALARDPRLNILLGSSGAAARPIIPITPVEQALAPVRIGLDADKPAARQPEWEAQLEIASFEAGAEGVAVLTLRAADNAELPEWQPGAHIDLILPNGVQRQYSLCGNPHERQKWRIGVLRELKSRGGSAYVHERLQSLGKVKVRGPRNHFQMPQAEYYRFVAGGIGITPILAMVREAERMGKDWQLLYGGRSLATMAFVEELKAYGDHVQFVPQDTHGLMNLQGYLQDSPEGTAVCCCGPEPLLQALTGVCEGLPQVDLYMERFTAPQQSNEPNTAFDVELRLSGKTVHVREDQSIVEAVREAGVVAYTSCQSGICGTCETPVLEGTPDHRDALLSAAQKAAGKSMMICVSRCKSQKLVLEM